MQANLEKFTCLEHVERGYNQTFEDVNRRSIGVKKSRMMTRVTLDRQHRTLDKVSLFNFKRAKIGIHQNYLKTNVPYVEQW